MWARVVEIMLGLWLVISPLIFGHAYADTALVRSDLASGTLVALAAIVALIGRIAPSRRWLRHAHLLTIAVALWLVHGAPSSGSWRPMDRTPTRPICGRPSTRRRGSWRPERSPASSPRR